MHSERQQSEELPLLRLTVSWKCFDMIVSPSDPRKDTETPQPPLLHSFF